MSSEGGLARFWDIFGPREPIGKEESQTHNTNSYYKYFLITGVFPLTEFEGEIVLSLRVDPQDHCLLAGDTSGVISIFDISQYATSPTQGQVMNTDPIAHCHWLRPYHPISTPYTHSQGGVTLDPMVKWRAHTGEILSIEHVLHETQPLVLSASGDCTVRLWTMEGHYIGMFGQVG